MKHLVNILFFMLPIFGRAQEVFLNPELINSNAAEHSIKKLSTRFKNDTPTPSYKNTRRSIFFDSQGKPIKVVFTYKRSPKAARWARRKNRRLTSTDRSNGLRKRNPDRKVIIEQLFGYTDKGLISRVKGSYVNMHRKNLDAPKPATKVFYYDEAEKLIRVEINSTGSHEESHTYQYSENGKVIMKEYGVDSFPDVSIYIIDSLSRVIQHTEYLIAPHFSDSTAADTFNIIRTSISYVDSQNTLASLKIEHEFSERIRRQNYTENYTYASNKKKVTISSSDGKTGKGKFMYTKNDLIKRKQFRYKGRSLTRTKYKFYK